MFSPRTLRRILLLALVCVPGCAALDNNVEGWADKPTHQPLPAVFVTVPVSEISKQCPTYANRTTHGCARRDYAANVCVIYVGPNAQSWLRTHELAHCAGFDHV